MINFDIEFQNVLAKEVNALFCSNSENQSLLLSLSVDRNMHDIEDYFTEECVTKLACDAFNASINVIGNDGICEDNKETWRNWVVGGLEITKNLIVLYVDKALKKSRHDVYDKDSLYNYHISPRDVKDAQRQDARIVRVRFISERESDFWMKTSLSKLDPLSLIELAKQTPIYSPTDRLGYEVFTDGASNAIIIGTINLELFTTPFQ
ncbi:hypothetical protein [Vibrio sp. D431a]|uniref:hypothetical protein n=1 Tax=Vibrio sp. D431a TaxID=2837388 RepID=UPI0025535472|nr:hypothetical protein [Vibrio sp. D431a]MDK9789793.1 hypothetical protein [Vibrio sp. D431a]